MPGHEIKCPSCGTFCSTDYAECAIDHAEEVEEAALTERMRCIGILSRRMDSYYLQLGDSHEEYNLRTEAMILALKYAITEIAP